MGHYGYLFMKIKNMWVDRNFKRGGGKFVHLEYLLSTYYFSKSQCLNTKLRKEKQKEPCGMGIICVKGRLQKRREENKGEIIT